ncbi:hypothetical protein Tco_1499620 [Tanacetum coccineum]
MRTLRERNTQGLSQSFLQYSAIQSDNGRVLNCIYSSRSYTVHPHWSSRSAFYEYYIYTYETVALGYIMVQLLLEEILWDKKYDMDLYRCKDVLSIFNLVEIHSVQIRTIVSFPVDTSLILKSRTIYLPRACLMLASSRISIFIVNNHRFTSVVLWHITRIMVGLLG